MRWRTRGSSANRTSSCTSRFPPSSAGCALPATTICTGRSSCSSRSISRSRSRSISVSRLYEGTRRAKPIVSTSGSSTPSIQPSSAAPAPRWRHDAYSRLRTSVTSCSRRARRSSQMSWSGMSATASQRSEPPTVSASSVRRPPSCRAPRRSTSGATQVGACTPLVTEVIGTSSASKPGHSPENISRLTRPCSSDTPLARWPRRRPITAMLNRFGSPPAYVSMPSRRMRSTSMRGSSASGPKCRATSSRSKRSMPAGTGVWVVKTVPARTASRAESKSRPSSASSAMRSRPRKPACPSLVWKTSGCACPVSRQYVRTARTPPMPSSISCSSRCSLPPPYSRSVTPRSPGSFSSTSESSSSSGTRPTRACQTRARSDLPPGSARETCEGVPSGSLSSSSGSSLGSSTG